MHFPEDRVPSFYQDCLVLLGIPTLGWKSRGSEWRHCLSKEGWVFRLLLGSSETIFSAFSDIFWGAAPGMNKEQKKNRCAYTLAHFHSPLSTTLLLSHNLQQGYSPTVHFWEPYWELSSGNSPCMWMASLNLNYLGAIAKKPQGLTGLTDRKESGFPSVHSKTHFYPNEDV